MYKRSNEKKKNIQSKILFITKYLEGNLAFLLLPFSKWKPNNERIV